MQTCPPPIDPQPRQGFTLVEVLVALMVLALTSVLVARVLQGSLQVRQLQQDEIILLQEQANARALQFSGEREDPLVTLEPVEGQE